MKLAADLLIRQKEQPSEIWFKLGSKRILSSEKPLKSIFGVAPKDFTSSLTFQD
jgi:hypothetical protein